MTKAMECRPGCAACCIAISISSPIPGMPGGKPAGIPCIHLTDMLLCVLFGSQERPAVCSSLQAASDICGDSNEEAFRLLQELEKATNPNEP